MSERYLANENFPAAVVRDLRSSGNDVVYAAETMVGAIDPVILQAALNENRVLLTFDQDFGDLVFRQHQPPAPGIVLFRLQQLPPAAMLQQVEAAFGAVSSFRGFFTVVSPGKIRQTTLPGANPGP